MIDTAEDQIDLDTLDLDDFDSLPFTHVASGDRSYLRSMWSGRSFRTTDDATSQDLVIAHGMVQSFVNAFSRDGSYLVTFDPECETAGTDMDARKVVLTPAPVADRSITAEQAGEILTGLAVHEISHPRYGTQTFEAVSRVFASPVALRLSNLLDDIRIERRFVGDYPGYAGIFVPVLNYVGQAMVSKNGGQLREQSLSEPTNLAIAATRYPTFSAWTPETQAEADWWTSWADRWSSEDAPRRHVEAIREALRHIAANELAKQAAEQAAGAGTGSGGSGNQPTQDMKDAAQSQADAMGDHSLDRTAVSAEDSGTPKDAPCIGGGTVADAAAAGDTTKKEIDALAAEAEAIITEARNVEKADNGDLVDVAQSTRGLAQHRSLPTSAAATRYIANAILRSRSGHTEVSSFQRRGRLDQSGLTRIAHGDTRLFESRKAPSPAKYLVWVMVDCSGSMSGLMMQASQVAHAIASATHGTPTVRMTVWGWSYPFRSSIAHAGVVRVWDTGQPTMNVFDLTQLELGGTPDAPCLSWAAKAIRREARADEKPVIIFVSDGESDDPDEMDRVVGQAKASGVDVRSVSFGRANSASVQLHRYGRGNFVPWAGSILATAKGMADMFVRITSTGVGR